jgi:hypothetical protein
MLFKTTSEFGKNVEKNTSYDVLKTHILDAEKQYIKPVLGTELYDDLNSKYAAAPATPLSSVYALLLAEAQAALRNLTMYIAIPKLNIRVSDIGVMKASSNDYESADGGDRYYARVQYLIDGYKGLDTLIGFLFDHKTDFTLWTASDAYTRLTKLFIKSTEVFAEHVPAVSNRYLFSKLLGQMDIVEKLRIKPFLGEDFFDALKGANQDPEEIELIEMLCQPIALYTYAEALVDPTIRELLRIVNAASADDLSQKGTPSVDYKTEYARLAEKKIEEADALMAQIRKHLNANASATVFPSYFDSDLYNDPTDDEDRSTNSYNNDNSESSFAFM